MASRELIADPRSVRAATVGRKLNKAEAQELTTQIRQHAGVLWQLVAEAHDRKAWQALGYSSWKEYAVEELQMSESRSFQVIQTGRVMRTIAEVSGDPSVLSTTLVTARETQRVTPHMSVFKKELEQAIKRDGLDVQDAVAEALLALPQKEPRKATFHEGARVVDSTVVHTRPEPKAPAGDAVSQELARQLAELEAQKTAKPAKGQKVCTHCHGTGYV